MTMFPIFPGLLFAKDYFLNFFPLQAAQQCLEDLMKSLHVLFTVSCSSL